MHLREVALGDVHLPAEVLQVGHADEVAGAGEAAGDGDLADLLELGQDDAAARRAERRVVERTRADESSASACWTVAAVAFASATRRSSSSREMTPEPESSRARRSWRLLQRGARVRDRERRLGALHRRLVVARIELDERLPGLTRSPSSTK